METSLAGPIDTLAGNARVIALFERLRDEYGFTGKITIVKDYICGVRQRRREMFVPLTHPPGHAQVDFGEALAVIGGVERKIHFLAMSLPHSDACFVKAYPGETTEAFCDGHVSGWTLLTKVETSCDRILIAGGANVEAEWEQGPAV